jgi:hypothetical protein
MTATTSGRPSRLWPLAAALALFALQAAPAYAYLDPVSASFVVQGLIAGFVAVLAAVRSFRQKVVSFFIRDKAPAPVDTTETKE